MRRAAADGVGRPSLPVHRARPRPNHTGRRARHSAAVASSRHSGHGAVIHAVHRPSDLSAAGSGRQMSPLPEWSGPDPRPAPCAGAWALEAPRPRSGLGSHQLWTRQSRRFRLGSCCSGLGVVPFRALSRRLRVPVTFRRRMPHRHRPHSHSEGALYQRSHYQRGLHSRYNGVAASIRIVT